MTYYIIADCLGGSHLSDNPEDESIYGDCVFTTVAAVEVNRPYIMAGRPEEIELSIWREARAIAISRGLIS